MNSVILFLQNPEATETLANQLSQQGITVHLPEDWRQAVNACRRKPNTPLVAAINTDQLVDLWEARDGHPNFIAVAPLCDGERLRDHGALQVIELSDLSAEAIITPFVNSSFRPIR